MSPNRNRLILFLLREIAEIRAMANDAWVRAQIDSDGQCGAYRVDVRAKLGAK